jgi:hypothetical protein
MRPTVPLPFPVRLSTVPPTDHFCLFFRNPCHSRAIFHHNPVTQARYQFNVITTNPSYALMGYSIRNTFLRPSLSAPAPTCSAAFLVRFSPELCKVMSLPRCNFPTRQSSFRHFICFETTPGIPVPTVIGGSTISHASRLITQCHVQMQIADGANWRGCVASCRGLPATLKRC